MVKLGLALVSSMVFGVAQDAGTLQLRQSKWLTTDILLGPVLGGQVS